jgi:hypothetical protein
MSAIRRSIVAVIVGGALALSAIAGAAAHHPGVDNPTLPAGGGETGKGHEMPQGPKLIACENGADNPSGKSADDGGWGVFNAIDRGGMVHCERDGEEDEGGYLD